MLEDAELGLDVVHVLLPPDLHASAASALIEQGIHVFLEKPMATTADGLHPNSSRRQNAPVTVGVNHNFLFAPVYEELRDDLRAGKLGRPDHVTLPGTGAWISCNRGPSISGCFAIRGTSCSRSGRTASPRCWTWSDPLEVAGVRASNPVTSGRSGILSPLERRSGNRTVAVTLNLSFSPGFTEQTIHVRGSLASATVDFERNTYLLHQHTRYGLDFDRYRMIDSRGRFAPLSGPAIPRRIRSLQAEALHPGKPLRPEHRAGPAIVLCRAGEDDR